MVSDIIGRDSPVIVGLPVQETWGESPELKINKDNSSRNSAIDEANNIIDEGNKPEGSVRDKASCNSRKRQTQKEEEEELKIEKLRLSVEIMEKESYERSLKILQMERELKIPPSKHTMQFYSEVPSVLIVEDNESDYTHKG